MIRATIEGLDMTIFGLEQFNVDVREAAFYAVLEALQKAFEACKTVIGADDHSLRELALMGHPYGFTHPQQIHDPDVVVHIQSGEYEQALRAVSPRGAFGEIIEAQVVNDSHLDRWIQEGTTQMRARPWMAWITEHYGPEYTDLIMARITAAIEEAGGT